MGRKDKPTYLSRWGEVCSTIRCFFVVIGVVVLVFIIMYYSYLIAINSPEQGEGISKIFEAMGLWKISAGACGVLVAGCWFLERKGKKTRHPQIKPSPKKA